MSANERGGEHYKKMAIEPWDVIDTWPVEQRIGFYRGNLLKYTLRLGSKDAAISEAKKAQHYAEKLVETLEQAQIHNIVMNMERNDLSMSICDSMNLADTFLKASALDGLKWTDENRAKPVEVKYEVSTDGVNWTDDLRYGEKMKENWSESDEDRMRVVISNGNDGAAYEPVDGRGDDEEVTQ